MLRAALLAGLLLLPVSSACASGSSRALKWPKSHVAEHDGGESLAPRQASTIAAIEKSEDVEVKDDKPVTKAEKPTEAPAAATPAAPVAPTNDVITTEDIVIEIEDD